MILNKDVKVYKQNGNIRRKRKWLIVLNIIIKMEL